MTRATLLSLLAHPAALRAPDVRALEELAQAFPYCQTAHLLLAKAAHDQDSMLAAQRLRRAATYATDRTRLRQLIELPALVAVNTPLIVEATVPVPALAGELPAQQATPAASGVLIDTAQNTDKEDNVALEDRLGHVILPVPEPFPIAATLELPVEVTIADEPAAAVPLVVEKPTELVTAETIEVSGEHAPATLADAITTSPEIAAAAIGAPAEPVTTAEPAALLLAEAAEVELPAQAPPIRPPVAAEAARFEFGLATSEVAELTAYRLPELEEPGRATPPATPRLPLFSGAPDINYIPGEGSRLGFCLVPAEFADPAAMPGSGLPPVAEFFAPDALLLDFLAALPPAEPLKPSSLELINSFLQRAPLASRRRAMPSPAMPDPEAQADLSLPSTRVEPDLVSENLAIILVRQGKNERAIAVYERLMAKYPEKAAHFATQIRELKSNAEI